MKRLKMMTLIGFVLMLALTACGGGGEEQAESMDYRVAAIFPGTITDADYNTLGHLGITAVNAELGVEIAFSETNLLVSRFFFILSKIWFGLTGLIK